MRTSLRSQLSYANVMATIAVFVALGGTSYAALKVTGKQVEDGSLTGRDIKNRSLRPVDFPRGALPRGAKGDPGPQGVPGPKGDTGTVDTSQFYDKAAADARFLGVAAAEDLRTRGAHDEVATPGYDLGGEQVVRTVNLDLAAERKVLLIGTADAMSGENAVCRAWIRLEVDGTELPRTARGATAPALSGVNGAASLATTAMPTLAAGSHTITLSAVGSGGGCFGATGVEHTALEAVVLDR